MQALDTEAVLLEQAPRADSLTATRKKNILPAIWVINLLPLDGHKDETSR